MYKSMYELIQSHEARRKLNKEHSKDIYQTARELGIFKCDRDFHEQETKEVIKTLRPKI